jgi:hypothetical protein
VPLHTTVCERVLHLLLFVSGGIAVGVIALALLERAADRSARTIRNSYVVAAAVTFVVFFTTERIYHWLH